MIVRNPSDEMDGVQPYEMMDRGGDVPVAKHEKDAVHMDEMYEEMCHHSYYKKLPEIRAKWERHPRRT